jgi:photosystem II stability/assembly factor-like uncharacterized protein
MSATDRFNGLLEWRLIGPFRGGRVVAVAGDYHNPNTFYFGACAGGVWKTTDAGTYWQPVSDGFFRTASVGALAVAPSDSQVIYAGTGETTIRIDVSHGDGVYKSTDAGRTWQHLGLDDTRHIGKIRVHPSNPDLVYVAALGHAFGPNPQRGVFKSSDGGATWKHVLFKSEKAGAVDLSLDANPRIIYAAIWEAYRSFSMMSSGGPDSGLWQSSDGGETWVDISERPGLPTGLKGKIGVAASPAQPGRVWALIEHQPQGGLYRSDDAGATWEKVSDNQNLLSRAWYYTHITADPVDPETVYINNLSLWRSNDGGRTFGSMPTPHGDNHDIWIDPRNNQRMIQGNDGGACVSYNAGASWSTIYNQPTAQFYHLATDHREPYIVYGTQQDNTSIAVPSRTNYAGIGWRDCFIAGTGESGYIAVHPDDSNIVFVGAIGSSPGGGNCLQRYDHRTKQIRLVTTWPEYMGGTGADEHKYRFNWTYPIVFSPHDSKTIYIGGNLVFKTSNEGQTWVPISPDLSRADPETLKPTGGPINRDSIGAEMYATVFALAESAHEAGVLWAGSDDGYLHISRDAGTTWQKIGPQAMPEWTQISCIELSPFDKGTAYVVGTRYKLDDYRPYIWKTSDYGQSWQAITAGLPETDFTRVLRADPVQPGLLFVGTETGVYVSFDDGAHWERMQLNLPVAPIHELLIKGSDLIAGTHGRSIWILDDITPLRQRADQASDTARLFTPRPTIRRLPGIDWSSNDPGINYIGSASGAYSVTKQPDGNSKRTYLDVGVNPPRGVIVTYELKEEPTTPITLSFSHGDGSAIRSFSSAEIAEADKGRTARLPAKVGWNRFVWDMNYPPVRKIEGKDPPTEMVLDGPCVAPGAFQVTLTVGEQSLTQKFTLVKEPEISSSEADLQAQFDLLLRIHRKLDQTVQDINRMRDLRQQLDGWSKRLEAQTHGKGVAEAVKEFKEQVLTVEKLLLVPDLRPGWADSLNQGVRLLEKLAFLPEAISLGDYKPTDAAYATFDDLSARIDEQVGAFARLVEERLPQLNTQIAELKIGALLLYP